QRQLQALYEPCGPPWIHSMAGAGSVAEDEAGVHSQPPPAIPSTSVSTHSREPGGAPTAPGAGSSATVPSAVIRTGRGGAAMSLRRASRSPPGAAAKKENPPPEATLRASPVAGSTASTAPEECRSPATSSTPSGVHS